MGFVHSFVRPFLCERRQVCARLPWSSLLVVVDGQTISRKPRQTITIADGCGSDSQNRRALNCFHVCNGSIGELQRRTHPLKHDDIQSSRTDKPEEPASKARLCRQKTHFTIFVGHKGHRWHTRMDLMSGWCATTWLHFRSSSDSSINSKRSMQRCLG